MVFTLNVAVLAVFPGSVKTMSLSSARYLPLPVTASRVGFPEPSVEIVTCMSLMFVVALESNVPPPAAKEVGITSV